MPHNNIHEKRFLDESVETKCYCPYKGMPQLQKESKMNQSICILKNIFSTYKHLLSYNTIIILFVNEYKKIEVTTKKTWGLKVVQPTFLVFSRSDF